MSKKQQRKNRKAGGAAARRRGPERERALITRLGGPRRVAEALGKPEGTVLAWTVRGISVDGLPLVMRLAREQGIDVISFLRQQGDGNDGPT